MKNSTLSRRPAHDMRPNSGVSHTTSRVQTGDGEDWAFNGQMGDGVNRMSGGISCANPMTIGDAALSMNYGMGPRTGNASSSPRAVGPSATRDKPRLTIATAAQAGGCIDGGTQVRQPANPNQIYMTRTER